MLHPLYRRAELGTNVSTCFNIPIQHNNWYSTIKNSIQLKNLNAPATKKMHRPHLVDAYMQAKLSQEPSHKKETNSESLNWMLPQLQGEIYFHINNIFKLIIITCTWFVMQRHSWIMLLKWHKVKRVTPFNCIKNWSKFKCKNKTRNNLSSH